MVLLFTLGGFTSWIISLWIACLAIMFHDLCIPIVQDAAQLRECICRLLSLGYGVVALNRQPSADGRLTDTDRCTVSAIPDDVVSSASSIMSNMVRVRQLDGLAATSDINSTAWSHIQQAASTQIPASNTTGSTSSHPEALQSRPALRQLTRLTYRCADPVQGEALASATHITSTYDLLAVQPLSERALQQACTALNVDIITMDACSRLPFKLKPGIVKPALARGIMFEVCYSGALHDPAARVLFISNVQALARCTRGRNIILSSGAQDAEQIRSPHAVASLFACIIGQSAATASHAIACNASAAVAHGKARQAAVLLGPLASYTYSNGLKSTSKQRSSKSQGPFGYKKGRPLPVVPVAFVTQPYREHVIPGNQAAAEQGKEAVSKKRPR